MQIQTVLKDEASGHSQRWMRSLKAADTVYAMVPLFRDVNGHTSPLDALQKYGNLHRGRRPTASRTSPGNQVRFSIPNRVNLHCKEFLFVGGGGEVRNVRLDSRLGVDSRGAGVRPSSWPAVVSI